MNKDDFESILVVTTNRLNQIIHQEGIFTDSKEFENAVRSVLEEQGLTVNFQPHPQIFPDIPLGDFGIEVKFTTNDTWRSIANSIFEGMRDNSVKQIYLIFGKMGGTPEVKWGKYDDCVIHVRTSHVPRFEVEMTATTSLFKQLGISYEDFHKSTIEQKMVYVRKYARGRLKPGEHFWWLEDKEEEDQEHSLPLEVRIYMNLDQTEKRRLRAEAALLCPQIVKPSRTKDKYSDAVSYLLTYRGVLCPQARDLFSAGSVALRANNERGGNYIKRALADIEDEMILAAQNLEDSLFQEYWGENIPANERINRWLELADKFAIGWIPSRELFISKSVKPKA